MHIAKSAPTTVPTTLSWIFDPLPPSGAIQGGIPTAHVFEPDLDTFVREILQNSRDQKAGSGPVRVTFNFDTLHGNSKEEFIHALAWRALRPHIEAAVEAGFATVSGRLREGLRQLNDHKKPLTLLRIDDSGTRGLTGGENERGGNFSALCRNVLDTAEDRPYRGGSFGLGKAVLWSFSSISTILFSSRIDGNPRPGFRFFGRSELPYHSTGKGSWNGPGWYGIREAADGGVRAISAWDKEADLVARRTRLFRGAHLGCGTSILIVGFNPPDAEEEISVHETAAKIAEAASRWFWPSLISNDLEVSVVVRENGSNPTELRVDVIEEVRPFAEAVAAPAVSEKAYKPGDVAERLIPFRTPARKPVGGQPGQEAAAGHVALRVRRAREGEKQHLNRCVALIRGSGMVVRYHEVRGRQSETPFHGVLLAGRARGETPSDDAIERFLRAAEPPSHTEWDHRTDRIRLEYRQGGRARLMELRDAIDTQAVQMVEDPLPPDPTGPERLARLFRVGGRDGRPPKGAARFRHGKLTAHFDGDTWVFTGRMYCYSADDIPWRLKIALTLAGETGHGENLPIHDLTANEGSITIKETEAVIDLPPGCRELKFEGRTREVTETIERDIARRTLVRLNLWPALVYR